MIRFALSTALCVASGLMTLANAAAQPLTVKPLVEKKVDTLPPGPLYWRIETIADRSQAQTSETPWSLRAESAGTTWLFTLGEAGKSTPGASKVAEVGPIPAVVATQYLLRITEASGPAGSITSVHTHPGSEAFYVLTGEQTIRTPDRVMRVREGEAQAGHGADVPMQVSSSGARDLHALVMFVVDARRPFSSPASMP